MTKKTAKYFAILAITYREALTYFAQVIARLLTMLFRLWIFHQLYTTTFKVINQTEVSGLTVTLVLWLLMITQVIQTSDSRVAEDISNEVKTGQLAYTLGRPYSYLLFHYFRYWGKVLPKLGLNLLVGIPVTFLLVGGIKVSLAAILGGSLLLFLGSTLNFLVYFVIGTLAFWFEETEPFRWIYQKMVLALGGSILPPALFPETLKRVAHLLPFAQVSYAPSRILISFDNNLFWTFLLVQVFWLILLIGLARKLLARGTRRVTIHGG